MAKIKSRLRQLRADLSDRRNAERLASTIRRNIVEQAPTGTGTLRQALSNARFRYSQAGPGVWDIRVSNRAALGSDSEGAPRGTIAAFLAKYPQFRAKNRVTPKKQGRDVYGRFTRRQVVVIPPAQAWWRLSARAKDVLQRERERGRFGGERAIAAGRAPYFWVQSKKTSRALSSAARAGLVRGSYSFVADGIARGKAEFAALMKSRRRRG